MSPPAGRPQGTLARPPTEFPPHGIPEEPPGPGLAHPTPPIGGWWCHNPRPSRHGWHIACPHCLEGRVRLAPDPADPFGYELRPETCTAGCAAHDVMRWYAVREGGIAIFFAWLDRRKRRAA